MWGALSRLFVKNDNPSASVDGENTETMDKQASHQDMDTVESKQVRKINKFRIHTASLSNEPFFCCCCRFCHLLKIPPTAPMQMKLYFFFVVMFLFSVVVRTKNLCLQTNL